MAGGGLAVCVESYLKLFDGASDDYGVALELFYNMNMAMICCQHRL